jgi:hypothetical protein
MNPRCAIVVTTIFEPNFLPGFLENLRRHGRAATTTLYVIVDRKTPQSVARAAAEARADGFKVVCPDLAEQESYLARLGLSDFVPWDTDNRRNVGFLMALESGCEVLISIDDDNYCLPTTGDFVGEHVRVGTDVAAELAGGSELAVSRDGWFNVCGRLEVAPECYPRGFPYFARRASGSSAPDASGSLSSDGRVVMNVGLWLSDPDVDAATRLVAAPRATGVRTPSVLLGPRLWSPVNTQNTALTREAALVYYYVQMGHPVKGMVIDRYGDILSGYLIQKCLKHLGNWIRVGTPILDHRRTPHNLFKDLYHELAGMSLLEDFLPWLTEVPLQGTDHLETYACLAEGIQAAAPSFRGLFWDEGGRDFLVATARRMNTWLAAVQRFR